MCFLHCVYSSSISFCRDRMEEKLVEVSEQEVVIDFRLGRKCRANVCVKSLNTTTPIAFKVQTSSPHKFLVNPPNGLIPPLSSATFQIILKPQTQLPSSFPRSPSDRFLIKTTTNSFDSSSSSSRGTLKTYDVKLKVAYVGLFLLRHSISLGDLEVVSNIIKRQKNVIGISPEDKESLIRVATESGNSEKMVNLIVEAVSNETERPQEMNMASQCTKVELIEETSCANKNNGDVVPTAASSARCSPLALNDKTHVEILELEEASVLRAARRGDVENLELLLKKAPNKVNHIRDQYGLTSLHAAAIKGHKDIVSMLVDKFGMDVECQDKEGHTALHLAVVGGNIDTVTELINKGANVNAMNKRASTPIYMAKAMGYNEIMQLLINRGASSSFLPSPSSSPSSLSL